MLHAMCWMYIASWLPDRARAWGAPQASQAHSAEDESATADTLPSAELPWDDVVASLVLVDSVVLLAGLPILCSAHWWPPFQRPGPDEGNVPEDFFVLCCFVLLLVHLPTVVAVRHGSGKLLRPLVCHFVALPSSVICFVFDGVPAPVGFHLDGFELASMVLLPSPDLSPEIGVQVPPGLPLVRYAMSGSFDHHLAVPYVNSSLS